MPAVYYDLAQTSLVKSPSSLTEVYYSLWVYSNGSVTSTATASGGSSFLQKGSTAVTASTASATKLHTLSSNWQSSQKFAFEASIFIANSSATANAALWDFTAGAVVSGSQISTTSTTATLLRSGQFTLIPGRQYGVTIWTNNATYSVSLNKAHFVALLS